MIVAVGEDLALPDEGEGSPLAPVGGAPSLGGENGAGLLFPLPGGGHLEEAEDLENSVDPEDYPEDISDVGNPSSGPSDAEIIQGGSSCEVLVSDFGELERFRKKSFSRSSLFSQSCASGGQAVRQSFESNSPTATMIAPPARSTAAMAREPTRRWKLLRSTRWLAR